MKKGLRLYRGLKADDFTFGDEAAAARHDSVWRAILEHRQKSSQYPLHINRDIIELHNEAGLRRQSFSDCRQTAERYLGRDGGLLVELEVPLDDILRHFEPEIQNYAKRKQNFEIVYAVQASVLARRAEAWKFRAVRIDPQ